MLFLKLLLGMIILITPLDVYAAKIGQIRTSDSPTRMRIVMDVDTPVTISKEATGTEIDLVIDASLAKNQLVKTKDAVIGDISLKSEKNKTRLNVKLKRGLQYKVFTLKSPNRIVVDIYRIVIKREERQEGKGLKYTFWQDDMNGLPVKMYILEIAPDSDFIVKPISAAVNRVGRGRLSAATSSLGAKAAINTSYFGSTGWVIGNSKWRDIWFGVEKIPRSAFVLDKGKAEVIKDLVYNGTITFPNEVIEPIRGVNRERLAEDLVLYNRQYGSNTKTNEHGREVKVVNGKVTVVSTAGNMAIDANSLVLSGHGQKAKILEFLKVGDKVVINQTFNNETADIAEVVVGAGPSLLTDGKVDVRSTAEKIAPDIARGRAPRTAIGIKKDGTLIFLVVDGRQTGSSGMTLAELAGYFQKLGAVQALNFDGGGSSSMVLNGRVVNRPSDGAERSVSMGLGIFKKN